MEHKLKIEQGNKKKSRREKREWWRTASHGWANWPIAGPLKSASRDGSARESRSISDDFAITVLARIRSVSLAAAKNVHIQFLDVDRFCLKRFEMQINILKKNDDYNYVKLMKKSKKI